MTGARAVHVVVPEAIDDPRWPSGGNTYDRHLCQGLPTAGWTVHLRRVPGAWPWAASTAHQALAETLHAIPDGSVVVVDGLIASTASEVMVPASRRLRTVVLMHLPVGTRPGGMLEREGVVLRTSAGVVTTSEWTRQWLLAVHGLAPTRVHVACPGVDPAERAAGGDGGSLLCVGTVMPRKGQDVMVAALAEVAALPWRCVCVGALDRAPGFVTVLRRYLQTSGLEDRVELVGPLTGEALDAAYAGADALLLASRAETYGMVVTEALARAVPVLASDVGGVPEALGTTPDGEVPGLLTPAGDAGALAGSLRSWLGDPGLRRRLQAAADLRRDGLTGWPETAGRVAGVLEGVA